MKISASVCHLYSCTGHLVTIGSDKFSIGGSREIAPVFKILVYGIGHPGNPFGSYRIFFGPTPKVYECGCNFICQKFGILDSIGLCKRKYCFPTDIASVPSDRQTMFGISPPTAMIKNKCHVIGWRKTPLTVRCQYKREILMMIVGIVGKNIENKTQKQLLQSAIWQLECAAKVEKTLI